jgi:hypothetical protein
MVSDQGLEELHAFAELIEMNGRGFGGDHYDLTEAKRELAIRHGAIEVTSKRLVVLMQPNRKNRIPARDEIQLP